MSKSDKYASLKGSGDNDGLEELSKKLAEDLRKQMRKLGSVPLFSEAWFEMADVFGRMAMVSDMESKLAAGKEDKTIWETEEQALRFLMEDGKLNLCLRNLIDFKLHQRRARIIGAGPIFDFKLECDKFERGLGVVLKNAWLHIEALQTTDLTALINHIADTLENALEAPDVLAERCTGPEFHQLQDVLVFYYLHSILKHVEDIEERRVMPLMRERGVFMLGVKVISKIHSCLISSHTLIAVGAMSMMTETEDFSTYHSSYVNGSNEDIDTLVAFKTDVISNLSSDFENRKVVRPLVDSIDKAKRQARTK